MYSESYSDKITGYGVCAQFRRTLGTQELKWLRIDPNVGSLRPRRGFEPMRERCPRLCAAFPSSAERQGLVE